MTAATDASHCQGVEPQSYGIKFEVDLYDANHIIVPLLFFHSVSKVSEESWGRVFSSLAKLPGCEVDRRVSIVDQEKRIDKCYRTTMQKADILLDALHVK